MRGAFLNDENKGDIVIYQSESGETKIDVRFQDETVWLTQAQMEELFQSSHANVVEHIKNIYSEGELDESSTCRKFRQVRMQGAGNVSHNQAMDKATQEYHKFEVRTLSPVEQEYLRTIQLLNKKAKDKNREKPTK
mgnify:CR=1 FL=1